MLQKNNHDLIQLKTIHPQGEIELSNLLGNINITADLKNIKIEATAGKIDIHSLQAIDIKAGPIPATQKNLLGEDTVDQLKEILGVITDYMTDIISGDFAIGVLIGGFLPSPSVISKSISAKVKLTTIKSKLDLLLSQRVKIN